MAQHRLLPRQTLHLRGLGTTLLIHAQKVSQQRHSKASSRLGYLQRQAPRLPAGRSGTSSRSVVGIKAGYTAPDFYYFIVKPQPEVTQRHKKGQNGTTSPATTPNPTSA